MDPVPSRRTTAKERELDGDEHLGLEDVSPERLPKGVEDDAVQVRGRPIIVIHAHVAVDAADLKRVVAPLESHTGTRDATVIAGRHSVVDAAEAPDAARHHRKRPAPRVEGRVDGVVQVFSGAKPNQDAAGIH
jgi:hypothetical protein